MMQRSLVLFKTDAVQRGIMGEILHRFERCGLKIVGMKMIHPTKKLVEQHYLTTDENLRVMGGKTIQDCAEQEIDLIENVGTDDPLEIGKIIWQWNVEFLTSGPLVAIVLEGPNAIKNIRNLVGHTIPMKAQPGTIRGDFALDSSVGANMRKRTIYNLVHASGNPEEAKREIDLWFKSKELVSYKRVHEDLYSY
jgi:nucleoside-diphosphate kinase